MGGNALLQEHLDYDPQQQADMVAECLGMLNPGRGKVFNPEQRAAFDAVMAAVDQKLAKCFFLHSAGGGGKTFVCNMVAAAVRAKGRVALCVGSSGVSSLLMTGGRTSHSCFRIPIPVFENSSCPIKKGSDLHEVLKHTDIIIWDEVPMQHKHCIEAVDRTLQDVLDNPQTFGGITVLFGGDFRQTMPVVPHGTRGQIISASLRKSNLWEKIEVYHLRQNMRLETDPTSEQFANWLLQVGSGAANNEDGTVMLPAHMKCGENVASLIDAIYPGIQAGEKSDEYFLDRTILSCRNDEVDDLNHDILAMFPGENHVMTGADSVILERGADSDFQPYPMEFLNSIKASGLPLAHLALKEGCPLMLLRNLDPANGLCNGTRLILLRIRPRVLECHVMGGKHHGQNAFIPRISLEPSNEQLPLKLRRHQFPVRLAFAMTINKSQGQSVKHVGLDLRTPVFSHGQLYVALSRCTNGARIKMLFPEDQRTTNTQNIVYPEILSGIV
jgi:hypothetical protein